MLIFKYFIYYLNKKILLVISRKVIYRLIVNYPCPYVCSQVQALTHTGRVRPSPLEEAMELYQIGRFLELDILSQGCEDLILEYLTLESLPTVLK